MTDETEVIESNNVIDFLARRKDKEEGRSWPKSTPPETEVEVTATGVDPTERDILISTVHGDVKVRGMLGLSATFLAVGRPDGSIKFAAAPGMWQYAVDVTDTPVEQTA